MKKTLFMLLAAVSITAAQPEFTAINSMAGAFSRMGFGARGIGMGNAMSAVTAGQLVSYYNPALGAFQQGNSFQTSYSFLTLDRSLNFVNYTKQFAVGKSKTDASKPRSYVGLSIGIINSGVSKIDARDNQGIKWGDLSTSENQFFAAISNRFSDKLSIGIAFKFFYYKLYEQVTSSGLGFDIGALYSVSENMNVSLVITDLNSAYEWDTGNVYGSSGNTTKNKFPLLKKLGVSYNFRTPGIIAAMEIENSNAGTNIIRGGAEYNIFENLFLRGGFDKLNLSNFDDPVRPSFGFSYFYPIDGLKIGVDYAFVIEPYSSGDQHIIGVNVNF